MCKSIKKFLPKALCIACILCACTSAPTLSSPIGVVTQDRSATFSAKAGKAGIAGHIVDKSGNAIKDAIIYVANVARDPLDPNMPTAIITLPGVNPETRTSEDGYFEFPDLKPGTYALTIFNQLGQQTQVNLPRNKGGYFVVLSEGQTRNYGIVTVNFK